MSGSLKKIYISATRSDLLNTSFKRKMFGPRATIPWVPEVFFLVRGDRVGQRLPCHSDKWKFHSATVRHVYLPIQDGKVGELSNQA